MTTQSDFDPMQSYDPIIKSAIDSIMQGVNSPEEMMDRFGIKYDKSSPKTSIQDLISQDGDTFLRLGSNEYTDDEAQMILSFLIHWFYGSNYTSLEQTLDEEVELIKTGFGGFVAVISRIITSEYIKQTAQEQLVDLWQKHLSRPPTDAELDKWANQLIFDKEGTYQHLQKILSRPSEILKSIKEVFGDNLHSLSRKDLRSIIDMLERSVDGGFIPKWDVWEIRAECLRLIGNFEEAIPEYQKAIDGNHEKSRRISLEGLANCFLEAGKLDRNYFEDGLYIFITYSEFADEEWMVAHALGKLYIELEDVESAIDQFKQALQYCDDPTWGWTSIELYNAFQQQRHFSKAMQVFTESTRMRDWGRFHALGHLYQTFKKDFMTAADYYEDAVVLQDAVDFPDSSMALIECWVQNGEFAKAHKIAVASANRWKDHFEPYFQLGKIRYLSRRYQDSVKLLQNAAKRNGKDYRVWHYLGIAITQHILTSDNPPSILYLFAQEALKKSLSLNSLTLHEEEINRWISKLGTKPMAQLRILMSERLSLSEVQELCFDQGIDFDELRGDSKKLKVMDLIRYFERQSSEAELLNWLRENRRLATLEGFNLRTGV